MDGHDFSLLELMATLLGLGLTGAFAAWAAVIKSSAQDMGERIDRAIHELALLREELHRDRLQNEKRFTRLEQILVGKNAAHED